MSEQWRTASAAQVIAGFRTRFRSVVEQFVTEDVQKKPSKELIYHYTDDNGLIGIVEKDVIRFTEIVSLNDPSELIHGVNLAAKAVEAKVLDPNSLLAQYSRDFRAFAETGTGQSAHFFVACFSQARDELGQWRAYANDACGFSLVFDRDILEQAFAIPNGKQVSNYSTFGIDYDEAKVIDIQTRLAEIVAEAFRVLQAMNFEEKDFWEVLREFQIEHTLAALRASIFFKHKGYRTEEEYRFLQLFPRDGEEPLVERRYRANEVVKFREFKWKELASLALKEVMIGPAADKIKSRRLVEDCIRKFPSEQVKITESEIPYRCAE